MVLGEQLLACVDPIALHEVATGRRRRGPSADAGMPVTAVRFSGMDVFGLATPWLSCRS